MSLISPSFSSFMIREASQSSSGRVPTREYLLDDGAATAASSERLPEDVVIQRETAHFDGLTAQLRAAHPEEAVREQPLGLAISGGGIRAAAFHCGIFWALAHAGLLKDVQHLSAVSGGGYTAASYVTYVLKASEEMREHGSSASLDDWYRKVTCRFILRMQANISYLVDTSRDRMFRLPRRDSPEEAGSSSCPRILDLPLFVGTVIGSMTASPILLALQTLWPMVLLTEFMNGAMLRSVWCDPFQDPWANRELLAWVFQNVCFLALLVALATTVAAGSQFRVCPVGPDHHNRYLVLRSFKHLLKRAAIIHAICVGMVLIVLSLQQANWGTGADPAPNFVRARCHGYVTGGLVISQPDCSDVSALGRAPWYLAGSAVAYFNETWAEVEARTPEGADWDSGMPFRTQARAPDWRLMTILGASFWLACIASILLCRKITKIALTMAVPLVYLGLIVHVARWRIFGPITSQMLLPSTPWTKYDWQISKLILLLCTICASVTLVFYDVFQKLAHVYYKRALRRAFFRGGEDVDVKTVSENPYCPNLMFKACLHDYRRPWEEARHTDFTMSTLFIGCRRTGFYSIRPQQSLARLMTIAGAATDATFLLNADMFVIRFFLAVLALRIGDFVYFQPPRLSNTWIWLRERLKASFALVVAHIILFVATYTGMGRDPTTDSCRAYKAFNAMCLSTVAVVFVLSFFTYFKPLRCLIHSPIIQQLQLLLMHHYKAMTPPPYLYISDGGLIEALGIIPLLRRRLARIVVSDAAEDPDLTMRCLREAFKVCRDEAICSFYDPCEPHRDIEFVLREFRGHDRAHLHLRIRYEAGGGERTGDLFYVRMRLLSGDDALVRPVLSERDLLGPPGAARHEGAGPRRRQLSGACCPGCDCAGLCVGRLFPHFGQGNQFLTPVHFANLCHLGAEAAEDMVAREMAAPGGAAPARGPSA